jgi:mRNA interferase MazF
MPAAKPGEVWRVDLGMAAKVRPCLVLTAQPRSDELDVFTVVAHTTSPRGNQWEVKINKPFLDKDGVFDVQRIATVAGVKLERKLGELSAAELDAILDRLAERLGI